MCPCNCSGGKSDASARLAITVLKTVGRILSTLLLSLARKWLESRPQHDHGYGREDNFCSRSPPYGRVCSGTRMAGESASVVNAAFDRGCWRRRPRCSKAGGLIVVGSGRPELQRSPRTRIAEMEIGDVGSRQNAAPATAAGQSVGRSLCTAPLAKKMTASAPRTS